MFDLPEEIVKILKTENVKKALDLGAGRGQLSLLCSDHGVKTVAVDNGKSVQWQFDESLLKNENIEFISDNIEDYLIKTNEMFDLVLIINVVAFIKRDVFLGDLLQKVTNIVNEEGSLIISFFFGDDPTMQSPNISFYTFDDFIFLENDFEVIQKIDMRKDDLHKPHGRHKHHIGYLILKKQLQSK